MKHSSATLVVVLLSFLSGALLLDSGCASKKPQGPDHHAQERIQELKQLVEEQVQDPKRVEAMLSLLDRANGQVKRQAELLDEQMEAIADASRRHDTSREELESMLAQVDQDTLKILDVLQEAHFEMKTIATEEEWTAIVEQERKFLGLF